MPSDTAERLWTPISISIESDNKTPVSNRKNADKQSFKLWQFKLYRQTHTTVNAGEEYCKRRQAIL